MEEEKQVSRYTLRMEINAQKIIADVAKQFKISQQEVLEVMAYNLDIAAMGSKFEAVRNAKLSSRQDKNNAINKIRKMSAEQIAALTSVLGENK